MSESTKTFADRDQVKIRFGGSGGQGAVLAATILGEAAVQSGLFAAGSSSYGSRARGGAASSDLILSPRAIDYPHVSRPDILAALSQEACDESSGKVEEGGIIVYDPFFIKQVREDIRQISVGATEMMLERFGSMQGANMVMAGVVAWITGLIDSSAVFNAIASNLDERFHGQSKKAFTMGKDFAVAKKGKLW
ncbi:MAG: 2-oxoacid:acceptor oxidoreductase family protein [Pseudomonadota bacterium]